MSDRTFSATVIFEKDFRVDDAQEIMNAISNIKGVIKVVPTVATTEDYIAYARARQDLQKKLFEVLQDEDR